MVICHLSDCRPVAIPVGLLGSKVARCRLSDFYHIEPPVDSWNWNDTWSSA